MVKQLSEYTKEELQDIGRKEVERRIKYSGKEKENRAIMTKLFKAYQDGKIKLPGE